MVQRWVRQGDNKTRRRGRRAGRERWTNGEEKNCRQLREEKGRWWAIIILHGYLQSAGFNAMMMMMMMMMMSMCAPSGFVWTPADMCMQHTLGFISTLGVIYWFGSGKTSVMLESTSIQQPCEDDGGGGAAQSLLGSIAVWRALCCHFGPCHVSGTLVLNLNSGSQALFLKARVFTYMLS